MADFDFLSGSATADTNTVPASGGRGSKVRPRSKFGVQVVRSAGSTDAVDIDLQTSFDGTNWTKFADIVTSVAGGTAYAANVDEPVALWRVYVTTVGAGNTLQIYVVAMA
jgi:hypothetical protein